MTDTSEERTAPFVAATAPPVRRPERTAGAAPQPDQTPVVKRIPRPPKRRLSWAKRYARMLVVSDVVVIVGTFLIYALLALPDFRYNVLWIGGPRVPYWAALTTIGMIWLFALSIADTRDEHIVGHSTLEYRRIVNATISVFALAIVAAFLMRMEIARSIFLVALPIGAFLLLMTRWGWRQWLRGRQRRNSFVHKAVVLGEREKSEHIVRMIRGERGTGFQIVGAVTKRGTPAPIDGDLPVIGTYDRTEAAVVASGADTVIFAGADDIDPRTMRELGWAMSDRDIDWVFAPALTDIAGPRIHARPVAGLPLIHIEFPVLEGLKRFLKRGFDLVGSSLLILLCSPVMLAVAIAIKLDGKGPLFYTQERIGRRGHPFGMIKFRSMVANADDQLASLLDLQGSSDEPLFKVNDDPRITRVGRFLRKHSLDELPQLFNVFRGEMSLVGPRPQRPAEVALYDSTAYRRLLVKPGMSGLWQVSGRSALSWEDALRLDLYYVENWSLTQDVIILFRTVKAVVAPGDTAG